MGESIALGGPNPSNQPILVRVLASSVSLSHSSAAAHLLTPSPSPFSPTAVKEEAVVVLGVPPPLLIGSCPELHGSDAWKSLESPPSISSLLRGALLGSGMAVPLPPHLGGHGGKEDYVRMAARLGPRLATAEEERAFEAFHGRVWESCRAYFMCCFAVALCKRAALP